MKKLLVLILVCFSMAYCTENKPQSNHEVMWDDSGKDSVVHVQYVDNNGNMNNFFLNYLIFRSLFYNGGYSSVYNYYNTNRMSMPSSGYYSNYHTRYVPTRNSVYNKPILGSSPSRNSYREVRTNSSPTRSYTSPIRSSPVRMSSPMRSSPMRMSSPSRR